MSNMGEIYKPIFIVGAPKKPKKKRGRPKDTGA